MEARIQGSLQELQPLHIELVNESHMHSGPASESHWNLIIVSPAFSGQRLLQRHRTVYGALGTELREGIHALTMRTLSPEEWEALGHTATNESPPCKGGSKG